MSGLACCQAAEAGYVPAQPAMARGTANSMACEWSHAALAGTCKGSERQSMRASELRTSASRSSSVWVQTELSTCGIEMT
jgi:hypothetical protein